MRCVCDCLCDGRGGWSLDVIYPSITCAAGRLFALNLDSMSSAVRIACAANTHSADLNATSCNTVPRNTTSTAHCNAVQHDTTCATRCNTPQHGTVAAQHSMFETASAVRCSLWTLLNLVLHVLMLAQVQRTFLSVGMLTALAVLSISATRTLVMTVT
jgi:hypothetical protein